MIRAPCRAPLGVFLAMPCYHPIKGYMCQDGRFRTWSRNPVSSMQVPCGQCVGCRLERSRQWAIRCTHEASLYSQNCFLTLTFDPEHLPKDRSLHYEFFQEFMKRLREAHQGCDLVSHPLFGQINQKTGKPYPEFYRPIRFYMCGEYGENFGRPHFHACLFNFDFQDKTVWRRTPQGHPVCRSPSLEALWPFGFSEIGVVTFQSAAYVARYIMKKVIGRDAEDFYRYVDPDTGEVFDRVPEFTKMSLKPGIGEGWIRKFMSDVYPHDYVIINGHKCRPPRYYDRKFVDSNSSPVENGFTYFNKFGCRVELDAGDMLPDGIVEDVFDAREEFAHEHLEDNTPSRLYVKETVALAKVDRLKRSL